MYLPYCYLLCTPPAQILAVPDSFRQPIGGILFSLSPLSPLHPFSAHPLHCVSPTLTICHLLSLLPSHPAQPFIRDSPMDLTVNQSSPATFSCTAQGNPVPTISWIGPSDNFTTEDTPGANFTVLSVLTIDSAVRALHEGLYTCSASNGVGPSPNSSATLTVQGTGETPPPHNTRCTVDLPRLRS